MAYPEKRGNTWRVKWLRPGTKDKYDSASGFRTREQALAYGREQEVDIRRGDHIDPRAGDVTLGEWAQQWMATIDVAPNTEYSYSLRLKKIRERWQDVPLSSITTGAYQLWEKELRARYARSYADAVLGVFQLLMNDAVSHRPPLLKMSPVPRSTRKRGRYRRPPRPERVFGTPEQTLQLAENARVLWGHAGYVFVLTKAYTGMRLSELYGLRREWCYPYWPWSDPGWPDNPDGKAADRKRVRLAQERYGSMPALRVQWQHQYVAPPGGGLRVPTLVPPKYDSHRNLVLPPFLAGLLSELLDDSTSEWVFPAMTGGPLIAANFGGSYWRPIVDGADERTGRFARPKIAGVDGLEELTPHGLRHGHKVWLDEDGGHSRVAVEERMGHRLQGVEGVYSHVTVGMELQLAASLQGMWESAR
ncbi:integrase [Peterkaempfera sp. SMS 1(5)a]|uniref:integrase n=1 Tax=Peterkaempfera podocarpi TaxID=3232308 RepID=UPI00366FB194